MALIYEALSGKIIAQQNQAFAAESQAVLLVEDEPEFARVDHYVVEGALVLRPTAPVWPTSGIAPLTLDISTIAEGSTLVVYNSAGDSMTITDFSEPLILTGADRYEIELHQPFPYKDVRAVVEVTNA